MSIENKSNQLVNEFISQFPQEKQNSVINFLIILGLDIAYKLGQKNPKDLYQTMKQLSSIDFTKLEYIIRDYSSHGQTEIREEIKKIQQQLVQLNQMFNDPEQGQSKSQDMNKYHKPHFSHNRFYTQNDFEDKQNSRDQQSENSKNQFKMTKRSQTNKSPIQVNVTAKITESPPPPIIYVSNVNKLHVKPHLDDHQIKQLLYSDNGRINQIQDDFDSISNRQHNQSPKSIKYTLNLQNGHESNRDNIGQRFQTHETTKKKLQTSHSSRQKKKVPAYLQNVESKIKARLDQDKQAFKAQKSISFINKDYDDEDDYNYQMSQSQQMTANFQKPKPSQESETYYEIKQYLINEKNSDFKFSPVQEMKTENQTASNSRKQTQNFKEQNKSQLKSETVSKKKNKQKYYYEQQEGVLYNNPIQVSDFQMSKQQSELSFDAFRKKAQFTSPYSLSLQQSSQPIQTSSKPDRVDDESSESFSNFTPPNKEVREFFQKQCIYQI